MPIDAGMTIADLTEAGRHRRQGEVLRLAVINFVPGQRRRYASIALRPDRIGAGDRAILCVLVVVEKDAVPFFLPPLACRKRRRAALHFARERESRAADFAEGPSWLYSDVHVNAARARCLRPADEAEV